jgi:flagellar hook-length control protein FliK
VPAQRFVAATKLEFSAPTTSWSSASFDDPDANDGKAVADHPANANDLEAKADSVPLLDGQNAPLPTRRSLEIASPAPPEELELNLDSPPVEDSAPHAPLHEMTSPGAAVDGAMDAESVLVEKTSMSPANARDKISVRHGPAPAAHLLDVDSIDVETLSASDDAHSAPPASETESSDADKTSRPSRGSEPAAPSAHRVARAALAARDLAAAAIAPRDAQSAPVDVLIPVSDTVSAVPGAPLPGDALSPAATNATEITRHSSAEPRAAALSWTAEIHHELAAKAREFFHRGETEMRFTLDPPEMGKLRVHLEISEHRVSATITATNAATAALLERDRSDLVRAFQSQGIEEVSVQVGAERDAPHEQPDSHSRPERESHLETPYTEPLLRRPRSSRSVVDCFV